MTQEEGTAPSRGSSASHQIDKTSSAKQTWGKQSPTPLIIKNSQGGSLSKDSKYLSAQGLPNHTWESPEKERSLRRPNGLHPVHAPKSAIHRRNIYPWLLGTEPGRSANGFQELCLAVPFCETKEKNVGTGVEAMCLLSTLPRRCERDRKVRGL